MTYGHKYAQLEYDSYLYEKVSHGYVVRPRQNWKMSAAQSLFHSKCAMN